MPDYLGRVEIPEVAPSGTFPITPQYGYGYVLDPPISIHRFGTVNAKVEQRFLLGDGAKRFRLQCQLTETLRQSLRDFWESRKGAYQPFGLDWPNDNGIGTTAYTVRFNLEPISWEYLCDALSMSGLTLVEIKTADFPSYALNSTETRFPGAGLEAALLAQDQVFIPLVKLTPKEAAVGDIFVSDRRCTIGAQLYLARLTDWDGISQEIGGASDFAMFKFGNADRAMRELANDTDLWNARFLFSFFHVGTGIKLDLWTGTVNDWGMDSGPEFWMSAMDGLYELGLPFPTRKVSRQCWKIFKNAANGCPATGLHDGEPCDKGFATDKGCRYHGRDDSFGGIIASPQLVNIKTDIVKWRYMSESVTVRSDSIYDQVVRHIYTDVPMPVTAPIAAGREEDAYYDALAIVSEGPIQAFDSEPTKHCLDDQPPHGPGSLGWRCSLGADPNTDAFSLGQGNPQIYGAERAAGTAFAELRRKDPKQFQLSSLEEHKMQVTISGGMGGYYWTAPGSRSTTTCLTNPVWIVVNALLRSLGLRFALASEQEAVFDCAAAVAAASICNDVVAKIVGSGTETQFKFIGALAEQKPLRDWITDILMGCLGYFTFANGKLRIGLRTNASAVEAFTAGNILFNSLRLGPIQPPPGESVFNHLTANFADEEYDFSRSSLAVYDLDHALKIGSATAPLFLQSELNLAGVSTKSRAARIISTRLRENLGGIIESEWRAARQLGFKTTVLALKMEAGMVCSLTHEDMPGGAGNFRITGWRLNKDYSIDISARTVTGSMYDLTTGPKPADVPISALPVELYRIPSGLVWHPYKVQPDAADPMFGEDDWNFGLEQVYETMGDGTSLASLQVTGKLPVNEFILNVNAPEIRNMTQATTGGFILGGKTYYIAICAKDAAGKLSPPSNIWMVTVPAGTNTNTLTISQITWPTGGETGYEVFGSDVDAMVCEQASGLGNPASIPLTDAFKRSTWGMPSPFAKLIRARVKRVDHAGVVGIAIESVGANTITVSALADPADDWDERDLSIIMKSAGGLLPLWNFHCTSYNPTTGVFTCTPDPQAAGVVAGDVLIIRTKPTTFSSTTIGDAKFVNKLAPSGLTVNEEKGNLVRIIAGTGRGQHRRIASNTATVLTIDSIWETTPDATSRFIIEVAEWGYVADATPTINADPALETTMVIPTDNFPEQTVLVQAFEVDLNDVESSDENSPLREVYLPGGEGSAAWRAEGYYEVSVVAGHAIVNLTYGVNQRVLLTEATIIDAPLGVVGPVTWTLILDQDATGEWDITLDALYFADLSGLIKTLNTRSQIDWIIDADGNNCINSVITGSPRP